MENTKHFKYIDEDKLLAYINKEMNDYYEGVNPCNYMAIRALEKIKNGIIIGLWVWQEGS